MTTDLNRAVEALREIAHIHQPTADGSRQICRHCCHMWPCDHAAILRDVEGLTRDATRPPSPGRKESAMRVQKLIDALRNYDPDATVDAYYSHPGSGAVDLDIIGISGPAHAATIHVAPLDEQDIR